MKIEKIELNKIKVTISALDLVNMNINIKSLTPNSPGLHDFLFEVMEEVRAQTGFNPYAGQVVVEATPNEGGIILTVTRLIDEKPAPKRPRNIRVAKPKSLQRLTYRFNSFENLCELFASSEGCEFKKASLYEYNENFFLIMPPHNNLSLSEFAETGNSASLSESFLAEHGKLHAEGDSLISMAVGVKELMQ